MFPMQERNSLVYQRARHFSVQDMAHLSKLFSCLREELAATVYCPNETSSTSEQILILELKEEQEMSPDTKQ